MACGCIEVISATLSLFPIDGILLSSLTTIYMFISILLVPPIRGTLRVLIHLNITSGKADKEVFGPDAGDLSPNRWLVGG